MGPGPKILAYCPEDTGETLCVNCYEDPTPVMFDGDEWMDLEADSDEVQELRCDGCNKVIDTYEPESVDDDDDDDDRAREATPEEKEEALRYQEQQNEENRRKRES